MKKKILLSALALMVVLETTTTAFAAGDGTYNVTDYTASEVETEMNDHNGVVSTAVKVRGGENGKSDFAVILPKTMDGTAVDKAIDWQYNVTVAGDIAGDEYVSIVPEETFALKQSNKEDITASVDQPITKFVDSLYNGILEADTVKMNPAGGTDVSTTGKVKADGISAGTWKGSFWFNLSLEKNTEYAIMSLIYETYPDISENDAILMTKTEAGLYDDNNNLLYTWDELLDNGWLKETTLLTCGNPVYITYPGAMFAMQKNTAFISPTFEVINQEALKGRLVIPEKYAGGTDEYVEYVTVNSYEEAQNYNPKYPSTVFIRDVDENLTTIIAPKNCTCTIATTADCATGFYCKIWKKPF